MSGTDASNATVLRMLTHWNETHDVASPNKPSLHGTQRLLELFHQSVSSATVSSSTTPRSNGTFLIDDDDDDDMHSTIQLLRTIIALMLLLAVILFMWIVWMRRQLKAHHHARQPSPVAHDDLERGSNYRRSAHDTHEPVTSLPHLVHVFSTLV